MARITFKQYIQLSENQIGAGEDFISGTMEMIPPKEIEIKDPNNPSVKIKVPNPEYVEYMKKEKTGKIAFPSTTDRLKVQGAEAESTRFDPKETPDVIKSGGQFKARAIDPRRGPYTNDYFFKGQGMFFLPPQSYKPEFMQR